MDTIQRGAALVSYLIIGVFSLLLARLFYLQVLNFQELGSISSTNSIRRIWVQAPRGRMIDRNGIIVVDNQPLYSVKVIPEEFQRSKTASLAKLMNMPVSELAEKIRKGDRFNRFSATTVTKNLNPVLIARLSENLWQLPGVLIEADNKRKYADSLFGSHLFGYLRLIPKEQLEKLSEEGYSQDDKIGFSGLEKNYEERLKGQKGARFEMVNPLGKLVGKYDDGKNDIQAIRGDDLYLCIDAGLQQLAEELMRNTGKSGAVVALDPSTGGILALVSAPDYDLDTFNGSTDPDGWRSIITNPQKPLFNRTVQAVYPPGSIYKMVLAMAALEEGKVDPDAKFLDRGSFAYGKRKFRNHGGHALGSIDMKKAIIQSSNVYFFNLMFKTGFENWTDYGRMFGFGEESGIDLPGERSGILPSVEYFDRRYGRNKWTKGYLISLAIGQGELGTTPVQLAAYTAAIANNGTWYQPHLVKGYRDTATGRYIPIPHKKRSLPLSQKNLDYIREAMRGVVLQGTGTQANLPDIAVSGKTGTAQNPHGRDHAWFIAFAPSDNPKIAITVLVENSGFGGSISAPIARELIRYYVKDDKKQEPSSIRMAPKQRGPASRQPDSLSAATKTLPAENITPPTPDIPEEEVHSEPGLEETNSEE
ncbi:penicillin-binding protein 2 [Chlorobium limicola]|uniref:Peptidoglycan glycosyltransferase n=1 Tax=Chlorobium limicola TaxID=1092 RepID=A0A117MS40_CHLLI|nr:penicillin-binding protein 2 [Chlorobium limicola]KUL32799.1 peptidoglycan glycosyltransferase [Chlorobium limicola]